jgi:hypothetical protein
MLLRGAFGQREQVVRLLAVRLGLEVLLASALRYHDFDDMAGGTLYVEGISVAFNAPDDFGFGEVEVDVCGGVASEVADALVGLRFGAACDAVAHWDLPFFRLIRLFGWFLPKAESVTDNQRG